MSPRFPVTGNARGIARYSCHGLTLEVVRDGPGEECVLARYLQGLWWVRTADEGAEPRLRLTISLQDGSLRVPRGAQPAGDLDGHRAFAVEDEFYLTDGSSLLHIQPGRRQLYAQLAPSFLGRPPQSQRTFWMFGLLKLLRSMGVYCMHAAGVVSRTGTGVLIIGASGSGKSTLTIGLIRQGWSYLSDDALLLRRQPGGVEALAWRRHVAVDAAAAAVYTDLPLGKEGMNPAGKRKRQVGIEAVYPGQQVASCLPQVLLFSRVVPHAPSAVVPLNRPVALKHLLAQSSPPLFDHGTMAPHLEVLTQLLRQASPYELSAGLDVYYDPWRLVPLLATVNGGERWLGW
jgi:hypothetical protein